MARTGSTTSRRRKDSETTPETVETSAVETEAVEASTENDGDIPGTESTTEVEETPIVSTDTVEPEATEAPSTDSTESAEKTEATEAKPEVAIDTTAFEAAVEAALVEKDPSTGTLPEVQIEAVRYQYRNLSGAKAKNAAKKILNDKLRDAVNEQDMLKGMAVMSLTDAVAAAGAAPKAERAERVPADPSAAYVDRLTTLHLAYSLAREDVPASIDVDAARAKVDEKVEALGAQADTYFEWVKSTADDKGDEPEVDAIVKKAVKAAQGKAATAGRAASTPRPAGAKNRNVRTHIAQVFADKEPGTFLKVAEMANAKTDEYPDADCSPGAITSALKSKSGVEGVTPGENDKGTFGATKN